MVAIWMDVTGNTLASEKKCQLIEGHFSWLQFLLIILTELIYNYTVVHTSVTHKLIILQPTKSSLGTRNYYSQGQKIVVMESWLEKLAVWPVKWKGTYQHIKTKHWSILCICASKSPQVDYSHKGFTDNPRIMWSTASSVTTFNQVSDETQKISSWSTPDLP